ncbi:hypothetical protein [Agarilytica rhodophyticola]|uniref:hypothetical protein n=1 Tax=Agarilytica rhodophyticola TaxID=1737490 RepID=UPI000B348DBF|nr:hypothetical protein [Agarilytica rhodophyticola]
MKLKWPTLPFHLLFITLYGLSELAHSCTQPELEGPSGFPPNITVHHYNRGLTERCNTDACLQTLIGKERGHIIVEGIVDINHSVDLIAGYSIEFKGVAGVRVPQGLELNIYGEIIAPAKQIFYGRGSVFLGKQGSKASIASTTGRKQAAWWGGIASDGICDGKAINKAMDSTYDMGILELGVGQYDIEETITVKNRTRLVGVNSASTILKYRSCPIPWNGSGNMSAAIFIGNPTAYQDNDSSVFEHWLSVEHLYIDLQSISKSCLTSGIATLKAQEGTRIHDVWINGFTVNGLSFPACYSDYEAANCSSGWNGNVNQMIVEDVSLIGHQDDNANERIVPVYIGSATQHLTISNLTTNLIKDSSSKKRITGISLSNAKAILPSATTRSSTIPLLGPVDVFQNAIVVRGRGPIVLNNIHLEDYLTGVYYNRYGTMMINGIDGYDGGINSILVDIKRDHLSQNNAGGKYCVNALFNTTSHSAWLSVRDNTTNPMLAEKGSFVNNFCH